MRNVQKRKHHYVPKFYLNNFLDLRVQPPIEPSLWVYDKQQDNIFNRAPKNVAFQTGFYDMKLIDGSVVTHIEDYFAKVVEAPSATILRKIVNQERLSEDEKMVFSKFIFYSHARVPNYLNYMRRFYLISELGYFDEHPIDKDPEIENMIEQAEIPDGIETLEFMLELVKIFAPMIYDMSWQVLMAPEGKSFITSDNPVILNDPKSERIIEPIYGWRNPNIHLTFPLSPAMCFLGTWSKQKRFYRVASSRFVRAVNFRTAFFASRYLFASRSRHLEEEILKINYFNKN